jgi:uncharacterized membrane protein
MTWQASRAAACARNGACLRPRGWADTPGGHRHAPLPHPGLGASVGPVNALTAWKFHDPDGAEQALERLQALASEGLISVDDAALVSWPTTRRRPQTRELGSLTGPAALLGGGCGMVLGLIFAAPLAGLAVGAASGAAAGSLADRGIDDEFVAKVRELVTPGTSALFLLSHGAVVDRVAAEMADLEMELVRSNLDADQERRLRAALAG